MESKEKKQVVSAITKATNILVTVGVDPTVDELSALLGLTLLLNKLDKHATAVFSGTIPSAISFLEPDKTFENTVDGLRDFIIALNKDKADHLRYKLDGDVVKIFITPYKNTIIRDTDLEFSQGDFNVELILALGVENKADLDSAVASHGRILHDATTITFSAGSAKSELGEIDWHASNASSLSEMLASLARDLGDNLIDEHIATAFMTGIVSNTERFSNNLTTSDVMKTAATLMGLGANQQLIASRLAESEEPEPAPAPEPAEVPVPKPAASDEEDGDGSMQISHSDSKAVEEPSLPGGPSLVDVERSKDEVLQEELDKVIPAANVDLDDLKTDVAAEAAPQKPQPADDAIAPRQFIAKANSYDDMDAPSMGGTLNATTEQAEEESRAAVDDDRNRVILSHDAPSADKPEEVAAPAPQAPEPRDEPIPAPAPEPQPTPAPEVTVPEPKAPQSPPHEELIAPAPQPSVEEALATLGYPAGSHPTLADLDKKTGHDADAPRVTPAPASTPSPTEPRPAAHPVLEVDDARAAVATALDSAFSPDNNPAENVGSQPLADLHAPAPEVPAPITAPVTQSTNPTAIDLPPLPPLPPLPDQAGGLPPLPPLSDMPAAPVAPAPAPVIESQPVAAPVASAPEPSVNDWQAHTVEPPVANDPGQFHIPGQK